MHEIHFSVYEDDEYVDSFDTISDALKCINEHKEFNKQFDCNAKFDIEIHNLYGKVWTIRNGNI